MQPTFESVLLESPDLLPLLLRHLDLVALARSAGCCRTMRAAADQVLSHDYWSVAEQGTIVLSSSVGALLTFIDVLPSGSILVSDSRAEDDHSTSTIIGGRVLLLGTPKLRDSARKIKSRIMSAWLEADVAAEWGSEFMGRTGWAPSGLAVAKGGRQLLVVGFRDVGAGSVDVGDVSEWALEEEGEAMAARMVRLSPAPPLACRGVPPPPPADSPPPPRPAHSLPGAVKCLHFGGLDSPLGCALSIESGRLFVVDSDHHRICVFDIGRFVGASATPSCPEQPPGPAREGVGSGSGRGGGGGDGGGDGDDGGGFLYSFGGVRGDFGRSGRRPGELSDPFDIALRDGLVYVSDASNDRISVFREDGTFVRCLPSDRGGSGGGSGGRRGTATGRDRESKGGSRRRLLKAPSGLAFLPDGRLVVASSTRGELSIFTLAGEASSGIGGEGGGGEGGGGEGGGGEGGGGEGGEALVLLQRFDLGLGRDDMLCGVCVDTTSPYAPRILVVSSDAGCIHTLEPARLATAAHLARHPLGAAAVGTGFRRSDAGSSSSRRAGVASTAPALTSTEGGCARASPSSQDERIRRQLGAVALQ